MCIYLYIDIDIELNANMETIIMDQFKKHFPQYTKKDAMHLEIEQN